MTTALIAEDEPLLAAALTSELARAWPALQIVATVGDGASAVAQTLALQPDVLFFDIQMPGMTGLEAAAELLNTWPAPGAGNKPFPALVFVTAYNQYAVEAFEAQAIDYLLKPVQPARLIKTIQKLQKDQQIRAQAAPDTIASSALDMDQTLAQLRALTQALLPPLAKSSALLQVITATLAGSQGNTTRLVPIAEVLIFEAADKYMRVLTSEAEYLIRTPLKDLLPQLDAQMFWQIHRGTVVRASAVHTAVRDDAGKLSLSINGRKEKLPVSRLYSHLFKAM